ncbi:hypothetical protein SAMN02745216_01780 [Desulfatibacillum alkenivorans DSM 16219]|jgi:hypothetical protein|uniref:Nucleoside recognition n=1 Tax=Desulfatibacillum alkenivorans DSM 16219 TaxID=1121393 RepID=A0A1M6JV87_9BACT|nr:hypothetical protein [Desulfatibacillum alkenivorans]SHJ50579.1 hypothetical protein SAMN02745216_01780 [Desulfatibacillum alkenivorans DSM 16219]
MLLAAVEQTAVLCGRVLPVMFISLFGFEVLMQLGAAKKIEPLGKPLAKAARLPPLTVVTFFASIGSLIAANTMLAQFHQDGLIKGRELVLGAVFNTVPVHFKETLTYQLPVILPLLGMRLCLVYVAVFWLSGLLKLGYVIIAGRAAFDAKRENSDAVKPPEDSAPKGRRKVGVLLKNAWDARAKLFGKMAVIIIAVTFAVQILMESGAIEFLDRLIGPIVDSVGFPSAIVAPVSVYIFSPIVGVTSMSALLNNAAVTEYQAIVALLAGGFLMVPVTRLRGTMPRYVSILGFKHGLQVLAITTTLSLVSRAIVLAGILLFW